MEIKPLLKKDWVNNIQSFFVNKLYAQYIALFLAGAFNLFSYAPFSAWPIVIITLSILIFAVSKAQTAKVAFRLGFFYGLGWFATGISWIHVAIADFGGMPTAISILLMALLDGYLALFPALACYLTKRFSISNIGFAFIPFWLICEAIRGWFLTGFPWLSIGYTQTDGPLAGYAPVIGEFGIQALLLIIAVLIKTLLCHLFYRITKSQPNPDTPKTLSVTAITILLIIAVGNGLKSLNWFEQTDKSTSIALVQGNIEQSIKWQPENEMPTMQTYLAMSQPHFESSDIVIWPEAAVPRLEVISNDFLREIDLIAANSNTALITGIVDYQPETNKAFNNIIALGKKYSNDSFGHYKYLHNNRFSKHHLLPIGEFVPFESFLRKLGPLFDLPMSSFSRGAYAQDNLIANDVHISPAICFEVAFSNQVRANIYQGEHASDLILTVSNDAWFGNSHGPWQHLQIAQMRAIEFAKPVIRVTNNGVTAVIDGSGMLVKTLPQFEAAVLTHDLKLTTSNTPYYQYGNLPVWCVIVIFIAILIFKRKTLQLK
ncbi:apolipoprotein N-acyltransferase [Psychrosphaera sp. 1_MG-2023]|uniref:apolipoprotein N-acyltransferase n=1 Tax=Psychrosphaera sp. 1_MG-2023 TaxID=3062643 RepID=UPI0026E4772E|nr:apolipoprotein N-acyltransferase [Psychrosphaera sp. 1_MG-2023]MDO6721093.1 apolipoprotein N-acyltransferase [Psychrosphaera sp. 1_MG-2023]